MWTCRKCAGWPCIPFFLFTFVIGNLVVCSIYRLYNSAFSTHSTRKRFVEVTEKVCRKYDDECESKDNRCFRDLHIEKETR
jgi:hypothetical protein